MDHLKVSFTECPRCGQKHNLVLCVPFERPAGVFTHWGMCPVTNEPVIIKQDGKL